MLCLVITLLEDHLRNLKSKNAVFFKQVRGEVKRSEKSRLARTLLSRVTGGLAWALFFLQWWSRSEPGELGARDQSRGGIAMRRRLTHNSGFLAPPWLPQTVHCAHTE